MNIFFDTSSLISLYHIEKDTEKLLFFLDKNPGHKIFLSEITLVESYSAILKKVRIKYGVRGLRTMDAIQPASAIFVKNTIDSVLTGDMLLKQFFAEKGFKCEF